MTTTNVSHLKFNKLSENQYEATTPVDGEFYITPCPTYALDSEAVHKNGDETISGVKTFNNDSNSNLIIKTNTIDITTPPAESNNWSGIQFNDKNNNRIFKIEPYHNPSGTIGCNLSVSRYINNAWLYNIFSLRMDTSGNKTAYLDGNLVKGFVKETWQSETQWYRVWSDGWIEQGGHFSWNGAWTTLTFNRPFTTTNYYINGGGYRSDSSPYQCMIDFKDWGTSSCSVWSSDDVTSNHCVMKWYACGY